ncbi:TolC family protein [Marinitoga aeolica]|uniref:TolC family protein n=1 Tax=Marinitoga aeolica TaxID=2809031 RepID=A0ABY8PRH5_9BACT|nr:TolC family protein [Marinitoga aeolica]WGS65222.1 TolC family protein [Marinitoga aeolica]
MKKVIFLFFVSLISLNIFALSTGELLNSVKINNTDYLLNELNYESNMIDYENAKITADSSAAKLNVQNTYYSIMKGYETTKINLIKNLVNYLFTLKNDQINLQIKQLSFENAQKNYNDSQNLYKKNLISHSNLLNSEYNFKNSQYNLENAKISLMKDFDDFKIFINSDDATLNYNLVINFPELPELTPEKVAGLVENDYDYLIQKTSYQITLNEYNATKDILTGSDLRKKEIDLKKKELNLKELKISKTREIIELINDINLAKLDLSSSLINLQYLEENLKDTEKRYDSGLIEKTQFNQSKISFLSTIMQINNKKMGLVLKYIDLYNYLNEDINNKLLELIEVK